MEKTLRKSPQNEVTELLPKVLGIFKTRYTYLFISFIFLIKLSGWYNEKEPKQKSSASLAQLKEKPISNEAPPSQEKLVQFAISLLGSEYASAGKTPSTGFDCSGFTQYVYKNFSIEIPPSSITQAEFGKEIDLADSQKGDLIFFKSPTFGNNDIGHVGIVVANENGRISFVHSSTSRGVVIDDLEGEHYKARYRSVRRVLQS